MARFLRRRTATLGTAPGSAIFVGEQKVAETQIQVTQYDASSLREREVRDVASLRNAKRSKGVLWVNVNGVHDSDVMRQIADRFGIHPLALEDIMNTTQRPKCESYDDMVVISAKMMRYNGTEETVHAEQLSLVLGRGFLLTFQERPGDVFDPVRDRIRKKRGRIRTAGSDYLAYSLLDTVVDAYISLIERLGMKIENLEEETIDDPSPDLLQQINDLRREMTYLRKAARPAREAVLQLTRNDSRFIRPATRPYLKDLLDLSTQATEAIELYREMLSDHLNNYNASVSNRMNDIMRVLTIFAAIFIPLTFIAGVYGMNFEHLPELHFEYGYYALWAVMILIAGGMVIFFRRKGWM